MSNEVVAVSVFWFPVPAWTYEMEETETILYKRKR